ncbi:hypothetical protein FIBSPDRAFT_968680 [Athelia psychrophila]|uniref:Uncharacterized protein n=1 Tax=Athelia psychrophila TaxID=1759441 RepID=A0A167UCJ4_9AGAM|nr:hypothetical protein FIBSPDRAFT_968680 [Fibularhizoctonia sp. CBS 109695]
MLIASSCRIRPLFLAVAFLLVFSLTSSIVFLLTVQYGDSTLPSGPFDYAFTSSAAPGWRPFNASRAPVLLVPGEHPAQPTLSQAFFRITPQCADLWVSRGECKDPRLCYIMTYHVSDKKWSKVA